MGFGRFDEQGQMLLEILKRLKKELLPFVF
jgi:hypothetical protein